MNWRWGLVGVLFLAFVIRIEAWKFSKAQHEQTERISGNYSSALVINCLQKKWFSFYLLDEFDFSLLILFCYSSG